MQEIQKSIYFRTMEKLRVAEFELSLEEMKIFVAARDDLVIEQPVDNEMAAAGNIEEPKEESQIAEKWAKAYIEYMNLEKNARQFTYSLIYVNEDAIPELVLDTGVEVDGCQILPMMVEKNQKKLFCAPMDGMEKIHDVFRCPTKNCSFLVQLYAAYQE